MCKLLLCHGADPNHANSAVGWTALHYAAYQGHPSVVCNQNILWLPAIQITLGVSLLRMISKSYAFEHPQHFLWLCAVYRNGLFYCCKFQSLYNFFNVSPFPRKHCIEHVEYVSFKTSDSTVHNENRLVRMSTDWYKTLNDVITCSYNDFIYTHYPDGHGINSLSFFLDPLQNR